MSHLYFCFHVISTRYSKILKYSQHYICDHLSGTKVRICSEYDAALNFSYIASYNLTKSFTFSFILFLSKESDSENFKQSSCVLCMLLKYCPLQFYACTVTDKMAIVLEFFSWCLTFSEFIVIICNRLKFILIVNTVSLSLTKF